MKKALSIIISLFIVLQFNIVAYAKNEAKLSAENDIKLTTSEQKIDINISNNPGLMGFMVTVSYPEDYVDVVSVSRGDVTAKGSFYDNLGMNKGIFDVVWNHSSQVKSDGTLFSITAKAIDEIPIDLEIKLDYKQGETFNERYEDVKLNCQNIKIKRDEPTTAETTTSAYTEITSDKSEFSPVEKITSLTTEKGSEAISTTAPTPSKKAPDTAVISNAVQEVLEKNGYSSLDEVKDKDEFIKQVNEKIADIDTESGISDIDELNGILTAPETATPEKESNGSKFMITVFVILFVVAVSVAIIIYLKKRAAK